MPTTKWIPYEKRPFRRGGVKHLGTLVANGKGHAYLLIGTILRQKGFDVTKEYELFFDKKRFAVGLSEMENGFKVTHHSNSSRTSTSYSIRMTGFCNRFDLRERYEIASARKEGELWVLTLEKQ